MKFESDLPQATQDRIRAKFRAGFSAYRGETKPKHRPSDPGDFGAGRYYSSCFYRARCHGDVERHTITLQNPIVCSVTRAYDLVESRFNTLHAADRELASRRATWAMQAAGHDGLISVNPNKKTIPAYTELEIVVFPKNWSEWRELPA